VKRHVILDGGLQGKNTVISEKFMAKLNETRGRTRGRPKSTKEDFSEDVKDAVIVNDSNFERVDYNERIRRDELDRLISYSHWNNLQVVKDDFFSEVINVLPIFVSQQEDFERLSRSKKLWMQLLKPILQKINEVANDTNGKVNCPFQNDLDLSRLDKWGRLATYIKIDSSKRMSLKKKSMKAAVGVCSFMGIVTADRMFFKIKKEEGSSDDSEEEWQSTSSEGTSEGSDFDDTLLSESESDQDMA
jgi:hypothetical protein